MTKDERKEYNRKWREDHKNYYKVYRIKNPDSGKDAAKKYHKENKEKIKKKAKEWRENNKEKLKEYKRIYNKQRINNDPLFKFKYNVMTCINMSMRRSGFKKKSRTHEILGCSYDEFKLHLESKFEDWMTWVNYGKYNGEPKIGWDIDHVIPTSSAKTEDEIIRLNHYTNLQPLCSKINRDVKRDLLI